MKAHQASIIFRRRVRGQDTINTLMDPDRLKMLEVIDKIGRKKFLENIRVMHKRLFPKSPFYG